MSRGTKRRRVYRLIYWSSRKKGDIYDPQGEADFQKRRDLFKFRRHLEGSKDIYRIETWKRVGVVERDIVVEQWHGNRAHLGLKKARMESADVEEGGNAL